MQKNPGAAEIYPRTVKKSGWDSIYCVSIQDKRQNYELYATRLQSWVKNLTAYDALKKAGAVPARPLHADSSVVQRHQQHRNLAAADHAPGGVADDSVTDR